MSKDDKFESNKSSDQRIKELEKEIEKLKSERHLQENSVNNYMRELEENNRFLESITKEVPIVIFATDKNGVFTFSDGKGLNKLGLKPQQVVGTSLFELYKGYDDVIDSAKRALEGEETHVINKLGELYFETTYSPIFDEKNELSGIVGIAFDETDRVKAEQESFKNADRFKRVLESSNTGIWEWNLQEYDVYFSPRWKQMIGYEDDELENKFDVWQKLLHPDDKKWIEEELDKYLKNPEGNFEKQFRMKHKNGSYVWIQNRSSMHYDENGDPLIMAGSHQDITKRRVAELDLKDAYEFNELILNNSQLGILIYDSSGQCVSANEAAAKTVGATVEKLLKQNLHTIDSWKKSGLYKLALDTMKNGTVSQDLLEIHSSFGKKVYLDCYFSRFYKKNEAHLMLITNDVTEKTVAQQDRDRFFDTTLALLCTASIEGYFLDLNPAFEKVLGYSIEELKSHKFIDFIHEDDIDSTLDVVKDLGKGGKVVNFVNRYKCKNGEYKFLSWSSIGYGEVIYASAIDITPIEEYKEQLEQQTLELSRSNEELEQFAYVASHDLQEPLRKIKNFTQMLGRNIDEHLDEKSRGYMESVTNATMRMQALINDLLSFSRVSSQGKEFENTDLNQVINEVVQLLELKIEQSGAQLQIDEFPTIKADERQIIQLFQNLVSNALKFNDKEVPRIKVGIKENTSAYLTVFIQDNGIGFDSEYRDQIFTIFQRLHTRNEYEGTGIGLAICKKIVERHNGRIEVESIPGEGTTFNIQLPK